MTTLLPWLPAFLFGGILILVGKHLQSVEKKRRLARKAASQYAAYYSQALSTPIKELGAYQSKAQKKQEEGIYKN